MRDDDMPDCWVPWASKFLLWLKPVGMSFLSPATKTAFSLHCPCKNVCHSPWNGCLLAPVPPGYELPTALGRASGLSAPPLPFTALAK